MATTVPKSSMVRNKWHNVRISPRRSVVGNIVLSVQDITSKLTEIDKKMIVDTPNSPTRLV